MGVTCPPVSEASAGAPEYPVDQVGQCPEQPPMPRNPFNEDPQAAPKDVTDLCVDGQDTDFPPVVGGCLKGWLNWKVKWLRRTEK